MVVRYKILEFEGRKPKTDPREIALFPERHFDPEIAPDQPEEVTVAFESGSPVAVDGEALDPLPLLERLNEIGGRHGVGRADIVENRFIGMKSRGVYETPGGTILHHAHKAVESLTLSIRCSQARKDQSVLVAKGSHFDNLRLEPSFGLLR